MTLADIRLDVVQADVRELPQRFNTCDVVRHPLFRDGHDQEAATPALTGTFLRRQADELGSSWWTARGRPRWAGVEPFRARRNLLSSQPMCFTLFGQLAADLDLATRVLGRVLPDLARVLDVRLEWAPAPAAQYLGDRTSFDAAVEYETSDGNRSLLGPAPPAQPSGRPDPQFAARCTAGQRTAAACCLEDPRRRVRCSGAPHTGPRPVARSTCPARRRCRCLRCPACRKATGGGFDVVSAAGGAACAVPCVAML